MVRFNEILGSYNLHDRIILPRPFNLEFTSKVTGFASMSVVTLNVCKFGAFSMGRDQDKTN